jgi:hypothetical protein
MSNPGHLQPLPETQDLIRGHMQMPVLSILAPIGTKKNTTSKTSKNFEPTTALTGIPNESSEMPSKK